MKTHELKTVQPHFNNILLGWKTFEIRKNDRDFKNGDTVILKEYDAQNNFFSGRKVTAEIENVITDFPGLEPGYCIFSLLNITICKNLR